MVSKHLLLILLFFGALGAKSQTIATYHEPFRPQIHFSPKEKWMNDPNGMVFYKGIYHLFFQFYPDNTVWGPMHWGHATSTDLVHWQQQPIALYPDSLGYIFSGSAVVDVKNSSGFGGIPRPPMVAIYTNHDPAGERAGTNTFQNQSIAYSLDAGKTWKKYLHNPVLKNPGIRDFRDPKVMWYEPQKKWIMTLATLDHITFYSSKNLKDWRKESEFGKNVGAHGGVWECPDLFSLTYHNTTVWILIVNLNPGGPNGGSATQYFIGDFNGSQFVPISMETKWLDFGPDEYAGVTWSNTGSRRIFLGWMNNWMYADKVPTKTWRGAATLPRDLHLEKVGNDYFVASLPVPELKVLNKKSYTFKNIEAGRFDVTDKTEKISGPCRVDLSIDKIESFSITLSNNAGQKLVVGYDRDSNQYYIDRSHSGEINFSPGFAATHLAPRISDKEQLKMSLVIDDASVELFGDDGLSVMTETFFPEPPYSDLSVGAPKSVRITQLDFTTLNSIWPSK